MARVIYDPGFIAKSPALRILCVLFSYDQVYRGEREKMS